MIHFNLFLQATALLLCSTLVLSGSVSNYTTMYEDGSEITFRVANPNLPEGTMVKKCQNGVWAAYNGAHYTFGVEDGFGWVMINTVDSDCTGDAIPQAPVRSARPCGITSDNRQPSATLFTAADLHGGSHLLDGSGLSTFDFDLASMVTINSYVEFFNSTDFSGGSFCFQPFENLCLNGVCVTWDFSDHDDLPFEISQVRSMRLGCSPKVPILSATATANGSSALIRTFRL